MSNSFRPVKCQNASPRVRQLSTRQPLKLRSSKFYCDSLLLSWYWFGSGNLQIGRRVFASEARFDGLRRMSVSK